MCAVRVAAAASPVSLTLCVYQTPKLRCEPNVFEGPSEYKAKLVNDSMATQVALRSLVALLTA